MIQTILERLWENFLTGWIFYLALFAFAAFLYLPEVVRAWRRNREEELERLERMATSTEEPDELVGRRYRGRSDNDV